MNNKILQKRLLFIDHDFHQHTKSSDFVLAILKEEYLVEPIFIDSVSLNLCLPLQKLQGQFYDVIVMWQVMPSLQELKKYISFKKIVFFPMYDDIRPLTSVVWKNYREVQIISFSKTLYSALKKQGFDVKYIQYFPKPKEVLEWGEEDSLFYWQRVSHLPIQKLLDHLAPNLQKIHIHTSMDPRHTAVKIKTDRMLSTSTWFENKKDLEQKILSSALYVAPRLAEGIGMSFLEAMAMGRCVIAPNYPTMNEYIQNGQTGFLYDLDKIEQLKLSDIRSVQRQALAYMQTGHQNWQKQKRKIIKWLKQPSHSTYISGLKSYFLFGKWFLLKRKKF